METTTPVIEPRVHHDPGAALVVLVDEQGRSIGTAAKRDVHHARTPLHLAFSCYVVDDAGRVLVTRRAWAKETFPGVVTNSVCGHPLPDEAPELAAARRALDELGLGITGVRLILPGFAYRAEQDGVVEHELCPVYVAEPLPGSGLAPDPAEVDDAWWVPWPQLRDEVLSGAPGYSPWCREQVAAMASWPDDPRDWPAGDPHRLPPVLRPAR